MIYADSWEGAGRLGSVAFADNALPDWVSTLAACAECLTTVPEYDNNGAATEGSD